MRRSLRRAIAPCLGICALLYFGYHTVQGDRSIIAYLRLNSQLARVNIELAESNEARAILTRRVNLLRPDNLDRDMLDEQARHILGLAHPHDVVIYAQ
ncbi:MAG: septum formation initiator family protein [Rhodospirillaceae bacterium]|nr:septum formation initiator family protein [Rhodospirillaceae bacterium]MBT4041953.1 septum formation initiator family protein [Rhodospirillaceae bacterium]MBT4690776.1 septum formation initiator family protein [Rhodospirillaceae bacterium]MBT5080318.1 septum formation initiator family protein [Rhodospirillaceae bacterium]MBT5526615.1 septum formation initiator family protein [Rhodospirillaceae bacterium]